MRLAARDRDGIEAIEDGTSRCQDANRSGGVRSVKCGSEQFAAEEHFERVADHFETQQSCGRGTARRRDADVDTELGAKDDPGPGAVDGVIGETEEVCGRGVADTLKGGPVKVSAADAGS